MVSQNVTNLLIGCVKKTVTRGGMGSKIPKNVTDILYEWSVPVVAGVAVAEEEGRGDDAEEPHLEKEGVPLEPEERLAVVEEGEVEVPHDEEGRLVEEPGGAIQLILRIWRGA